MKKHVIHIPNGLDTEKTHLRRGQRSRRQHAGTPNSSARPPSARRVTSFCMVNNNTTNNNNNNTNLIITTRARGNKGSRDGCSDGHEAELTKQEIRRPPAVVLSRFFNPAAGFFGKRAANFFFPGIVADSKNEYWYY